MKAPVRMAAILAVMVLLGCVLVPAAGAAGPAKDMGNWNIYGIAAGPKVPTTFTFTEKVTVIYINAYHYAPGVVAGTLGLRDQNGKMYGPWQTKGSPGQGGVKDAIWDANINVVLPPGTYTVVDSDPKTWSYNKESNNQGFAAIRYTTGSPGGFYWPNFQWPTAAAFAAAVTTSALVGAFGFGGALFGAIVGGFTFIPPRGFQYPDRFGGGETPYDPGYDAGWGKDDDSGPEGDGGGSDYSGGEEGEEEGGGEGEDDLGSSEDGEEGNPGPEPTPAPSGPIYGDGSVNNPFRDYEGPDNSWPDAQQPGLEPGDGEDYEPEPDAGDSEDYGSGSADGEGESSGGDGPTGEGSTAPQAPPIQAGSGSGSGSSGAGVQGPVQDPAADGWMNSRTVYPGMWQVSADGTKLKVDGFSGDIPIDWVKGTSQNPVENTIFNTELPVADHAWAAEGVVNGLTSSNPDVIDKFTKGTWDKMSDTQRLDALNSVAQTIASELGEDGADIQLGTAPANAHYDPSIHSDPGHPDRGTVVFNPNSAYWKTPGEAIKVIGHEIKHQQQWNPSNPMEDSEARDAATKNVANYHQYGNDPAKYAGQYVENDSNSFGGEVQNAIRKEAVDHEEKKLFDMLGELKGPEPQSPKITIEGIKKDPDGFISYLNQNPDMKKKFSEIIKNNHARGGR